MKEIELKNLRGKKEKHFLRENGEILAQVFNDNIHYLKDNKYIEIDNTLVKENNYYTNKDNDYHVYFDTDNDYLLRINKDNYYINIKLDQNNISNVIKDKENIYYYNILKNIDIKYNIISNKVKEDIILKDKKFENINYIIETNLDLLLENKKIYLNKDNKTIFIMNTPFMYDSNNIINNNINYELNKLSNNLYTLNLVLDTDWLNDNDRLYPVIIDPTITEYDDENSCYDTYIFPGDTDIDRNSLDRLKAGVERVYSYDKSTYEDVVNRSLIKFSLPQIGTGSQIIEAKLTLNGYPAIGEKNDSDIVTIHQITQNWDETTANWENMNSNYNTRIEGALNSVRSYYFPYNEEPITLRYCEEDITDLVKKWYSNTPNYGIMLKANTEEYRTDIIPEFFSKNNELAEGSFNPKPILKIVYRNQNGLENYLDYKIQSFSIGKTYLNSYNGNLTALFNIGQTISGKQPINLNLVYNTNDVVLNNNLGYGKGYKLSFNQTIKKEQIDNTTYLSYTDEDGTIHYFYLETENKYVDEDGLNLTINETESNYTLIDKTGNKSIFEVKDTTENKTGYLKEVYDTSNNKIQIVYDENNLITKIIDPDNQEINIFYDINKIIISNPNETINLNYNNNNLISIEKNNGTTQFTYNDKNIITKIVDEDGKGIGYEYYEQIPYRIKRITEYGLNNEMGAYFTVEYNYNSTTLIDNKNRIITTTFNNYGNIASISNLKSKDDLKNAYGQIKQYGESYTTSEGTDYTYKNKLLNVETPLKYVKNYINSLTFDESNENLIKPYFLFMEESNEYSETGATSLKFTNIDQNVQSLETSINVPKGKNYTFSAFFKNNNNIKIKLYYKNNYEEIIDIKEESLKYNDDFFRYDVTIYYPENAESDLYIKLEFESGVAYIDCIQLEEGEVANNYNLLENSDFSTGTIDWTLHALDRDNNSEEVDASDKFEIVTLENNVKALKVNMNPRYATSFSKTFQANGKAGESYNISFWYKHKGLLGEDGVGALRYNNLIINFNYIDNNLGHCAFPSDPFNPNENEWQYFSSSFVAEKDFDSFFISFFQEFNANEFYITNINLFKSPGSSSYGYDKKGNITEYSGTDNEIGKYDYDKNNQLVKVTNPKGKNFTYEYDKNISDREINAISGTGITNKTKYDEFGNQTLTKTSNYGKEEIETGFYQIRARGTNNYLKNYKLSLILEKSDCNHNFWKFEKELITEEVPEEQVEELGETITKTVYKIKHPILNKYIKTNNNILVLSNEFSYFELLKNKDGSVYIREYKTGSAIKAKDLLISFETLINDETDFEFHLENSNNLFIENSSEYTEDGRFIKKSIDTLLNETNYDIDEITGQIKSITTPNNQTTYYEYNDNHQVSKITVDERSIDYTYNANKQMQKIKEGNKEYNFTYDSFLNLKSVKLGENINLITNNYESNNGNLLSSNYGNGHTVSYEYDDFDRLSKTTKMNDVYSNKYDASGNIVKVIGNTDTYKYTYDLAKRLIEYRFNNFIAKYRYDENNNIWMSQYKLDDIIHTVENQYNDDDSITKSIYEYNYETNYTYDYLGRITNRNINNSYNTDYTYITNGKRTSLLVKTLKNNNDIYKYKYDKLNNITHIYLNDNLINRYYYDNYNELIKEHDYQNNQTIEYTYDNYGNLLSKKIYVFNTTTLVSENTYEYLNTNWVDQLTKFNNESITYDAIGNPLTIGNKTLTWINGRQLNSYNDGTNNISFTYNKDGIRISKKINDIETKYYVEGKKIILENKGSNSLYYIYDGEDELVGLKYNNDIYFYIKNLQGDIIGILDSNYQEIVKYKYDSWGNTISITDNNGNDICNNSNHIANINPFRYRGYYFDTETELYYLKARYYNPKFGRFLNADGIIGANNDIISNNLYAYCSNDPINNTDEEGEGFFSGFVASAFVGACAGVAGQFISDVVSSYGTGKKFKWSSWQTYVGAAVNGAVAGAGIYTLGVLSKTTFACNAFGKFMTGKFGEGAVNFIAGASGSATTDIYTNCTTTKDPKSNNDIFLDAMIEGVFSVASSLTAPLKKVNSGKNSFSAVFKSGLTKLKNNTAKNMSIKVIAKGTIANIYEGIFNSSVSGIRDGIMNTFKELEQEWD